MDKRFKEWEQPEFDERGMTKRGLDVKMSKRSGNTLRIVYSGDRDISVSILRFLIQQGVKPVCLMISDKAKASHAQELVALCNHLDSSRILWGNRFKTENGINLLKEVGPDYIISIHFPYVFPKEVLEIPKRGVLNLHPAYLPYNRGWHTPSWAICEETPYGATLHFVDQGIDTGDIVHQKQIEVLLEDTADTLYQRVKKLEFEVFKEAWPYIVNGTYTRKPQLSKEGTTHKRTDIAAIQRIDLNEITKAGDLVRRLRALTTNDVEESAYFEADGKLYRVQLRIVRE